MRTISCLATLALALGLTGCGAGLDQGLREPAESPTPAEVQRQPTAFLGRQVRWGGSVIDVRNLERSTQIQILAKPLNAWGEPSSTSPGEGRFIAEFSGFREPADYPEGTRLTVVGAIGRLESHKVGTFPYAYPVVIADTERQWRNPPSRVIYAAPFYDPWYRPWPAYPGPWYGPWY